MFGAFYPKATISLGLAVLGQLNLILSSRPGGHQSRHGSRLNNIKLDNENLLAFNSTDS